MTKIGISGRIASFFIDSKLTPLIVIASLLLGLFAVIITPREEEPQIVVPMVDVFVPYPGASAKEIEERVTKPLEKKLWEIKGVEYVYSMSKPGMGMAVVRFYVGENMEDSLVKLYNKIMSNMDIIPPGVGQPLVKPRSIDDVPILTLTLWSNTYGHYQLRRTAVEVCDEIKKIKDVSQTEVIGGERRQVRVILDPSRLKAFNLSVLQIVGPLQKANILLPSGAFYSGNTEYRVEAGGFLKDSSDIGNVVVGVFQGRPVFLRDVARIVDGNEEPSDYVMLGLGPSWKDKIKDFSGDARLAQAGEYPAVTITIAKKKGANATILANEILKKADALKGRIIPSEMKVTVTRNYGDTAKEKSNELLEHMLIATLSVVVLIAITLGLRSSVVVAVAVPVTLALTLLINYLYGYTLNRVTLFALIFSIGILVDDAIVVVENIHRHFKMHRIEPLTAILAVDEVGNPTILATFTVIAALLPMAFVTGLMGPYMRPIPVGASAAMIFSLLVAFIVTPWLSYRMLKNQRHRAEDREEKVEDGRLYRIYNRVVRPLVDSRKKRYIFFIVIAVLLVAALSLFLFKVVTVKMLPFDNKSEMQVIIDMPEGTTLEQTAEVSQRIGDYIKTVPEVTDYQLYTGIAAPFNFNGLVRHYFLRRGSNVADIQVNLVDKGERKAQSHDIAKRIRPGIKAIADRYGAKIKIAEIPPGPPVLSTLVAEVYGTDLNGQIDVARKVKKVFESTPGVVDVDWYVEHDQNKLTFEVDKGKAAYNGISTDAVARTLNVALHGMDVGLVHMSNEKEPVEVYLRATESRRSSINGLKDFTVTSPNGQQISLSELVKVKEGIEDKTIYRKNLKRVVYVIGDVAGAEESPIYAILAMRDRIKAIRPPGGNYQIKQYYAKQPWLENRYTVKWDGEWQITYEVFRDLGIAFGAVLILIYILVVAMFRSFVTPIIIMAPIPLTLVGILPGHWLFGAFFTATSMIGFIALAGIIVRNSILLVDFIQMEWSECTDLKEAIIKAGAVRFRPIALTAAAVVVGAFVMLFDPIFQGLAIAMMFGAVASTALTLVAIPLLYYEVYKSRPCPVKEEGGEEEAKDEYSEM